MKTTIELPDELLISAKQRAAQQRTTLKNLIERALRRELYPNPEIHSGAVYEVNELGLPVLKRSSRKVSTNDVLELQARLDLEDS